MNGVLGMTELLLETDLNPAQQNHAKAVQDSGKVLLNIINDILDLSKIEAGKLDLEEIDLHLGQLLEQTVKLFSANAQKAGLDFGYVIAPEVPREFIGDPMRVQQVLMNLLSNALKFTPEGMVRIDVSIGEAGQIRFTVKDTGVGMNQKGKSQLFKPFTQADQSTSRRYGGTGLGLAICKQLVEHMGGKIGAVSKKNHGSLFWFELPLKQAEGAGNKRLPGIDQLSQGPVLIAIEQKIASDAIHAFLEYYGMINIVLDGQTRPMEMPRLVISDRSDFPSQSSQKLIVIGDDPAKADLVYPIYESELVMVLLELA